jgi:type III restriction enzyme
LLYELAGQVVKHLRNKPRDEEETRKVLRCYQRDIARFVHAQMQEHYWEKATGYEAKIYKGFTELKTSAYTASASEPVLNFRQKPDDRSNMAKYLFGGFKYCLFPVQKFQANNERVMAIILENEKVKWFKPAKGQFQIIYKFGADNPEYQPDFVAETNSVIYMIEPKAKNEMDDPEVLAKKDAAGKWCKQASDYAKTYKGKPWKYLLIPHDAIAENMTLEGLARQFEQK